MGELTHWAFVSWFQGLQAIYKPLPNSLEYKRPESNTCCPQHFISLDNLITAFVSVSL
jgi:hypothetical protein